jgi:anti-sigma regulatory factor (Ser/Thr protein kinase)
MHTAPLVPQPILEASPRSPWVEIETVSWTFPASPVHARSARCWFGHWLEQRCPNASEQTWSALVAFSELVTNAVLHGAGPITVRARLSETALVCEVTDRCPELPRLLEAALDDEYHRGLSLVDALTARWEVRAAPGGGKTVCFLVELSSG